MKGNRTQFYSHASWGRLFYIGAQDGKVVTVNLTRLFLLGLQAFRPRCLRAFRPGCLQAFRPRCRLFFISAQDGEVVTVNLSKTLLG